MVRDLMRDLGQRQALKPKQRRMFSAEQEKKIEHVALRMNRLPSSLKAKMLKIEKEGLSQGGGKSGKFTMEENLRILEAMKCGARGAQGAREIARMLDRDLEA